MDFMDEVSDSDVTLRLFFSAIIDEPQEVKYKQDALNENYPENAEEASELLTE